MIAPAGQPSGDVQASGCHGHLLVTWRDGEAIKAAADGRVINVSAASRAMPAVACGRDSWLVVWPSEDFGVDGRRIALDGTLLAPISVFRGQFGASEVAAAYGESGFLVAWADGVTIRAARVSDAGAVIDATPITVAPTGFFVAPRIVWTGSAFFVAWAERRANPFLVAPVRLWGTRVTPQGNADAVSVPMIDSGAGIGGLAASLTTSGDKLTLAWVAQHGTQTCVDMAQVNESRVVLMAPAQLRCSDSDAIPVLDQAQVLWSRGELVLVWRELTTTSLSVLRAGDEVISQQGWGPGLATTSDGVAVVYFAAPDTKAAVYMRVIAQEKQPPRRRAAGH